MLKSQVAGGIVINRHGQILVVNQNNDSWSLPKGHIEQNEDTLSAAKREIAEESGVTSLRFIKKLGNYERYRLGKGGKGLNKSELKFITIFLFQTDQTDLNPTDPNNPYAKWVEIDAVTSALSHPQDREFFDSVKTIVQDFIIQN